MANTRGFLKRPMWQGLSQRIDYEDKQRIWKYLGYKPHPGEEIVHRDSHRFKVVNCGRRWGKTEGVGVNEIVPILSLGGWCWNCAADYDTATILFEAVCSAIATSDLNGLIAEDPRMAKGQQRLVLKSGGVLWAKSLFDDRRIRGRGLDHITTDEAAMQKSGAPWELALRPSLSDHEGGALFLSTPKGLNYFRDLHDRGNKDLIPAGEEDKYPDWMSWTFETASNPYVKLSEIRAAELDLPLDVFQQEYLAVFLNDSGGVFRGYMDVADVEMVQVDDFTLEAKSIPETGWFAIGVDVAVKGDFTVIWVIDVLSGRTVYVERFNNVDWDRMSRAVSKVSDRFGYAPVCVDATNNASFAEKLGLEVPGEVQAFIFTKSSKPAVLNDLALGIETKEFHLPDAKTKLGKQVLREFGAMQYVRNETTGNIKMQAATGQHDDAPIAAALAYYLGKTAAFGVPVQPGPRMNEDGEPLVVQLAERMGYAPPKITGGLRPKKRFRH